MKIKKNMITYILVLKFIGKGYSGSVYKQCSGFDFGEDLDSH